jgi:hypothetical protein
MHSLTHLFMIDRIQEDSAMFLGQSVGTVSIGYTAMLPPMDTADAFWTFTNEETPYSFEPSFERAFRFEGGEMELAHWFLILLFLVPWVGLLAWRVRKLRRLTKADA